MVLHGRRFQAPELHQVQDLVGDASGVEPLPALARAVCVVGLAHGERAVAGHGRPHGALEAGATGLGAVAGAPDDLAQSPPPGCPGPARLGPDADHREPRGAPSRGDQGSQRRARGTGGAAGGAGALPLSGLPRAGGGEPAVRGAGSGRSPAGGGGVRGGGVEVCGAGPVDRLETAASGRRV